MTIKKSTKTKAVNSDQEMPTDVERALISRLQIYEDTAGQLEANHEKQLREAKRSQRYAVAQSTRAVKDQLAYRFGSQLVRVFKNPLRLFILPYSLTREWIAFRRGSKELANEITKPNMEEVSSTQPPPAISLDIARDLDIEALAELNEERLLALTAEATQVGELPLAIRLAAARWFKTGTDGAAGALRLKRGQLIELAPDWLPTLPKHRTIEADPKKILHIFETIHPLESNDNAVRNWSIAVHQKEIGLVPVVSVTPAKLADEFVIDRAGRDGLFTLDNDGIEIWLCHFQNMPRKKIPRDTLLTFDTKLLAHVCARVNPSIVHATSESQGFNNALKGIALSKSRDIPFVYEMRSFHEHTWTTVFEGILDTPHTQLCSAQENRCMAEADAVVTISNAMADELISRGVSADKVYVVPNSVDERFLEPTSDSATQTFKDRWKLNNHKVIGCISDFSKREGHHILCDAFARLHESHSDMRLLIVGDGPVREELEQQVLELGLSRAAIFTGTIDHDEILAVYGSIDIFVVPGLPDYASDYVTPMESIEAMAMKCPLVMSDRPVSQELIGNEDRGLFFKPGDAENLHGVFETIFQDPVAAANRAARARQWVEKWRRWPTNAKLYEDVYAAAREEHKKAAPA